jgi:two-component system, NtrC family, phosphoglycerate transport system sensor histidine kinase PgtB
MKKWFKRLDISTGLQLSLIISALFCLFIGAVGLYTWHQQRIEIDFAIDQNFPKIQAAFRMEEQINVLENTLLNAKNIRNTEEKIKWFNALQKQIKTLKDVTQSLNDDLNDEIPTIVIKQANLLQELSSNIDNQLILNTKFNKILSEINWLHNDFRDEFKALLQEIIWQQTTLANHLKDNLSRSKQIEQLRKFQYELLLLYDFLTYEEQIVTELKQHIVNRSNKISSPNTFGSSLGRYTCALRCLCFGSSKSQALFIHSDKLTSCNIFVVWREKWRSLFTTNAVRSTKCSIFSK